jgi:hypothetical protein
VILLEVGLLNKITGKIENRIEIIKKRKEKHKKASSALK